MSSSPKIIAITGATASGKTKLAIDLALELKGEIVNADSVQVYQDLDIGSAKPSIEEQNLVKHHLISYLKADESYSVGRFRKDCLEVIDQLKQKKVLPIVTGGSGLYLSSLFSGFFDDKWFVSDVEGFLAKVSTSKSPEDFLLWSKKLLDILDPISSNALSLNDLFRRERALSLSLSIGAPISLLKSSLSKEGESLSGLVIILERERNNLYQRIDTRVRNMIMDGVIDEVSNLITNYGKDIPSLKAIGYSHIINYLCEENQGVITDIEDLIKIIQRDTRRFAKRQLTWWRNQPSKLGWIDVFNSISFVREITASKYQDSPEGIEFGNQGFHFGGALTPSNILEGVLEGTYVEIKSFLKYIIEKFRNDGFVGLSEASAFTSSETSYSIDKKSKSDLVYVCRVRCLD